MQTKVTIIVHQGNKTTLQTISCAMCITKLSLDDISFENDEHMILCKDHGQKLEDLLGIEIPRH